MRPGHFGAFLVGGVVGYLLAGYMAKKKAGG